jgi:hypothetical protein
VRIRVGGAYYRASPSFMTLLRHRALFDASYLAGQGTDVEALTRLVYAALPPEQRPEYEDFAQAAAADELFPLAAAKLRGALLRPDGPPVDRGASAPPPGGEYEYALLGLFAAQGLDVSLLAELTLSQAIHMIQVSLALRNPADRPQPMGEAERKKLYGITPDREMQVARYLQEHPDRD